jgi:hypothetical protein
MSWTGTGERRYLALAALLIVVYASVAVALHARRDFAERGPLSYPSSATADVPGGGLTVAEALERCLPQRSLSPSDYVVVEGEVLGQWYLACYEVEPALGDGEAVVVVDAHGTPVDDVEVLKASGAWPWVAVVSTGRGLVAGFIAVVTVVVGGWVYYRRRRPGPPLQPVPGPSSRWQRRGAAWLVVLALGLSLISLARTGSISAARKVRILVQAAFIVVAVVASWQLVRAVTVRDPWGIAVFGMLTAALLACVFGGWRWLAPADFDHPDVGGTRPEGSAPRSLVRFGPAPARPRPTSPIVEPPPSIPALTDVAIRQFRSAAQLRLALGTSLRWMAIALALFFFTLLAVVVGVGVSDVPGADVGAGLLALLLLVFYAVFFVVPGIVVALVALPLILGWRDPERILVLRPFNRPDHSGPLRGLIRREVAGYGHTYTLADVALRVRWYVTVPVLLGQLGLLSFRLRRVTGPPGLERLARAVSHRRRRNLNWAIARSKVFAIRCTDEVWRHAVRQMVQTCDAVLIDVTDLTGHLAWEIDLLRDLGRLPDCIFLSSHGTEGPAATAVERQVGSTVQVQGFDGAGRLVAPRTFRYALAAILFRATDQASIRL